MDNIFYYTASKNQIYLDECDDNGILIIYVLRTSRIKSYFRKKKYKNN